MKKLRPERKVERSLRDLKSKDGWIKRFDFAYGSAQREKTI